MPPLSSMSSGREKCSIRRDVLFDLTPTDIDAHPGPSGKGSAHSFMIAGCPSLSGLSAASSLSAESAFAIPSAIAISMDRQAPCGGPHGGEGGIRTHGTREGTTVFETVPIDHSGTSPQRYCEQPRPVKSEGAGRRARASNAIHRAAQASADAIRLCGVKEPLD